MDHFSSLRLESESSSSDEEDEVSIEDAYTVLDIRSGLLTPSRYCTAAQELEMVLSSLYKRRESTKKFKKLIEADIKIAIYGYPGGDFPYLEREALMKTAKRTLPQAKGQALYREYKHKILQEMRDVKRAQRLREQKEKEDPEFQNPPSFANLPEECIENIFSHLQYDPFSLGRAAQTCTTWRTHATSNKLWGKIMFLTFDQVFMTSGRQPDQLEDNYHHKIFSKLAPDEKAAQLLLPWRTDRIICHDTIRWCSPETRARVIAQAGNKSIVYNDSKSGVRFIDTYEAVLYVVMRQARPIVEMRKYENM